MPAGSYVRRMPWGQQKPLLGYGIDGSTELSQYLIAEWLFNENSGMPHELVTNTKCASTPLWRNGGLQISDHANRVDCDRNYDLAASEFTISMWLKLNSAVDYKVAFGIWNAANNARALQLVINGNGAIPSVMTLNASIYTDSSQLNYVWPSNTLQLNKLHHMTLSFLGTVTSPYIRYFVDSIEYTPVLTANGTGTRVPATGKWSIGSRYYTDLHIDGQIQHVSVFSKQFTSRMVATLYENPYCFIEGWNYGRVYSVPSGVIYRGSLIGDSALIGNGVLIGGGLAA